MARGDNEVLKVALRDTSPHLRLTACMAIASILWIPAASFAQDQTAPATSPDNTAQNKAHQTTADQQSGSSADRMTTKKIRQAVVADKSLSTYAHNVKIITLNGTVTLKGPVSSEAEKQAIASKAAEVTGSPDKVMNNLTVAQ
jgi:hyperosmotically inducible periplasmic protein